MRLSQTRFVYNINFYNISLFFEIFVLNLHPKCSPKYDNFNILLTNKCIYEKKTNNVFGLLFPHVRWSDGPN